MSLDIVVLAAGQGKRMHSSLPKVLHKVAGRPMLAYVLETARALTHGRIIVVHGHGGEAVRSVFAAMDVTWIEQAEQRGTGHALMQALPSVKPRDDVLVLYGDVPLVRTETLHALIEAKDAGLAILTADLPDPTGYGRIVRDAQGQVARIVEDQDASADERLLREVNVGFLVAQAGRLSGWLAGVRNRNAQAEFYLTDVVQMAVTEGVTVATRQPKDAWEIWGVNSRHELALVERAYQNANAKRLLDAGVTLADLWRVDVRGDLQCGSDVSIDVNCVFEGKVTLGDRVRIGPNCVLRNVAIAADSEVRAFSHLEEAQIGARCRVGPYARLRPGAVLAEEVHVGNFVEVKASRLGARTKANHLSYVGDAEVGSGVNIGAGTITCNYDGAAKHRTVIGDECFIGSDTTLVAPVTLARGSYIGAGSTINKDTPPDQLTVARAKQVTVRGWKPPRKK
jgi:bifunctional UDP-N-acetylglucosamine pyrophosphorylase/glucosamine-1-phosphate N-acetyltransferase